jgi:short-subunit dehydrogenase
LAAEGVHLALCARGEDRVIAVARAISEKYGIRAIGIKAYVSKSDPINHFVAEIEKAFGGADILANNAGTGSEETISTNGARRANERHSSRTG